MHPQYPHIAISSPDTSLPHMGKAACVLFEELHTCKQTVLRA